MENDTVYRQDAIDALADYIHNVMMTVFAQKQKGVRNEEVQI